MADWTSDANQALCLRLSRGKEDADVMEGEEALEVFHPRFTYPIFGDEEKIYGYQDLRIDLSFASGSLAQYLSVSSSAKLPVSTADDVEGTLFKFIPPDYYKDREQFVKRVEQDATTFKPMGEKVYSYTRRATTSGKGKTKQDEPVDEDSDDAVVYEVYKATWATPGFRPYHRKMQVFILLYIEAGSYIQEDEDKWEFMVLYERRRRKDTNRTETYHFVGYSTLYPFYCWPDKVRMRLSQFVILPPFQAKGHGASLYNAIYQYAVQNPLIAELTIEDPSEAFEDLRDKCDLRMLLGHEKFLSMAYGEGAGQKGKLGPPAAKVWVEEWRRKLKIAPRQFERLVEMLILRRLNPSDSKALRAFRLQVKERLYRFNYEIMVMLEKEERIEKLQETFEGVREDYERILALIS
ncbi:hypothetical protein BOTBODRAFT_154460 [Botryobasidium botryosum FD-172 SS1]|uniref:Histone acetyltransferase type B catalytic subunit n=1 Tax=Botryobasidium botryosum (strain FD-172 SS1) TaxID=930990 RepID=A0A067MS08_BOTB1|nr:hypothetical protein BOTBODRAFT_154460 [Botryobasidium botryosum FD-172 SS1]